MPIRLLIALAIWWGPAAVLWVVANL